MKKGLKHITLLLALLGSFMLNAQVEWDRKDQRSLDEADIAFEQEMYDFAYDLLQPLLQKDNSDARLNYQLGACAIELGMDEKKALAHLEKAIESKPEAYYYYGRALHLNLRFDDAHLAFSKYQEVVNPQVDFSTVEYYKSMTVRAKAALKNPVDVRINNMGPTINTAYPEYVPIVTADNSTLYFTSRRKGSTGQLKDPNEEYFEDIYSSSRPEANIWTPAQNIGAPVNTTTHDATVSISADGKTMIIYRTNSNLTGGDLYFTEKTAQGWSDPKMFGKEINSPYQEASACYSPDKNTLYFSSNRPGGYGGKDLYRVKRLPTGEWSLPKNLGPAINTPYDDDAPFMDIDNKTLYFSSKGHSTIGGYDVFRAYMEGPELWSPVENLGYPVNTVFDDIYLAVDAGGRKGYYSSDQSGGYGKQDLYEIDFIYRQQVQLIVKGKVANEDGEPVHTTITVLNEDDQQVQGIYKCHPKTGAFVLVLNPLMKYRLILEAEGHKTSSEQLFLDFPVTGEVEAILPDFLLPKE